MKYTLVAAAIPLLAQKTVLEILDKRGIQVSAKDARREYKAIISRQPDIGGMKNNLLVGLLAGAYLMAVHKVVPGGLDDKSFDGLVKEFCASKKFVSLNKGKQFFTKKNMETRDRLQSDPIFTDNPDNWHYTFCYDLSVPECTITYTRCAICEMARREGCFHLMRSLCTTDYAQQELMGNTLYRSKTIGNGDDICDFHVVGGRAQREMP